MRGRLWQRCALMACVILWPGVAHAQFWGYLQQLSGPGPFWGPVVTVRVSCPGNGGFRASCVQDRNPADNHHIVSLHTALQWSADEERFDDVTGDAGRVWVFRLEPTYQYRVHPAFDAGAGIGLAHFWGGRPDPSPGFSITRFTLTPVSLTFTPGSVTGSTSRAARLFRIRFDELFLPKGFTGADFGNTATMFHTDHEWLSSVSLILDLFER